MFPFPNVDKSDEYLQERVLIGGKSAASSFFNQEVANACLSLALDAHRDHVDKFLNNPDQVQLHLCTHFTTSIGFGYASENPSERLEASFVQIWLQKNPPGSDRPYEIVTAFPDLTLTRGNRFIPWSASPPPDSTKPDSSSRTTKDSAERALSNSLSTQLSPTQTEQSSSVQLTVEPLHRTRETFYRAVSLPGGVIIAPRSAAGIEVKSMKISTRQVGIIEVNGFSYDSGLSYEELYRLYCISKGSGSVTATSVISVEGSSASDIIGATLRLADFELGEVVFSNGRKGEKVELSDLLALTDDDLVARCERLTGETNAITSLEFKTPQFATRGSKISCSVSPVGIHFLPFTGSTTSPKFDVSEERTKILFAAERVVVHKLARSPQSLFSASPHFDRARRYAAALSLFNSAHAKNVRVHNIESLGEIFEKKASVIRDIPYVPTFAPRGEVDRHMLASTLAAAGNDHDFLRAATACFIFVTARSPKLIGQLEKLVTEELTQRVPSPDIRPSRNDAYMRTLTASLGLAAHSAIFGASLTAECRHEGFESQALRLAKLVREQKIDEAFRMFATMPLHSQSTLDEGASFHLSVAFAACSLIQLGYGHQLRELLLTRLTALACEDPSNLRTVASSIKAALYRCFAVTGSGLDVRIFMGESEGADLRSMITRAFLIHRLVEASSPDSVVNNHSIPSTDLFRYRAWALQGKEPLVTAELIDCIDSFGSLAKEASANIPWDAFEKKRSAINAHVRVERREKDSRGDARAQAIWFSDRCRGSPCN